MSHLCSSVTAPTNLAFKSQFPIPAWSNGMIFIFLIPHMNVDVLEGDCSHRTARRVHPVLRSVTTGSSIDVTGQLVKSAGAGQSVEILASSVTLVGACDNVCT
jgi:aspartyl/asparaginyl-tRNA synthetase